MTHAGLIKWLDEHPLAEVAVCWDGFPRGYDGLYIRGEDGGAIMLDGHAADIERTWLHELGHHFHACASEDARAYVGDWSDADTREAWAGAFADYFTGRATGAREYWVRTALRLEGVLTEGRQQDDHIAR